MLPTYSDVEGVVVRGPGPGEGEGGAGDAAIQGEGGTHCWALF